MNTKFIFLKLSLTLIFAVTALIASAQSGPSDATSAPPNAATDVSEVLCPSATVISLTTTSQAGYTYLWYKKDASGNLQLVQTGGSNYTETLPTTNAAGYYTYQLVQENTTTQCTSPASDPFSVYVLPPITVAIANNSGNPLQLCTNAATAANPVLTANVTASNGKTYAYTYQWTENGSNAPGTSTSSTYTVTDRTVGTYQYNVNVGYVLNSTCTTVKATSNTPVTIYPQPTKPVITVGP